jgi:hypothetical protein
VNWEIFKQRFHKDHLLKLFLVCAFPFHLWTIILVLNDVEWIARRSGAWDAIGVGAYALVYALIESAVFFLLIVVLGLILPWGWKGEKVFTQLGFISLWIPIWAGLNQLYRHKNLTSPDFLVEWLFSTGHPYRYGVAVIGLVILIVIGSAAVPIYLIGFNSHAEKNTRNFLERITLLSILYIALDVISVVILLIRNIG